MRGETCRQIDRGRQKRVCVCACSHQHLLTSTSSLSDSNLYSCSSMSFTRSSMRSCCFINICWREGKTTQIKPFSTDSWSVKLNKTERLQDQGSPELWTIFRNIVYFKFKLKLTKAIHSPSNPNPNISQALSMTSKKNLIKANEENNETNSSESHTHVCFVILPAIRCLDRF